MAAARANHPRRQAKQNASAVIATLETAVVQPGNGESGASGIEAEGVPQRIEHAGRPDTTTRYAVYSQEAC